MRFQNEHGFTLIESLLHCIIFAIAALGLAMLLTVMYRIPTTADVLHEVEWEVASFDVNQLLLLDVESIRQLSPSMLIVTTPPSAEQELLGIKPEYELTIQPPYLVKRRKDGFEPILTTIKQTNGWQIKGNQIIMQAKLQHGPMRERIFYAPNIK